MKKEIKYKNIPFKDYTKLYYYLQKELAEVYQLTSERDDNFKTIRNKIEEITPLYNEEKHVNIINYWKNINIKFNEVWEVPGLNLRDKEYEDYIIPALKRCGAITLKDLVINKVYLGNYRNGNIGKWNGEQFEVYREKFGNRFIDTCNHFEDDDNYALFVPIKEVDKKLFK